MDKVFRMNILYALEHLVCEHEDGLERELAAAASEEIFETAAEQIHDHDVVLAFDTIPTDTRNT
jgi:hypothetical protein